MSMFQIMFQRRTIFFVGGGSVSFVQTQTNILSTED